MSRRFRMSRRDLLYVGGAAVTGLAVRLHGPQLSTPANASAQVPQTALPGDSVARFVTPLTTFAGRRVTGSSVQVGMRLTF